MTSVELTRDRRFGGRWTAAQTVKNGAIHALATGSLVVATRLPRPVLGAATRVVADLAWATWPGGRRRVEAGLRAAGVRDVGARDVFRGLGVVLADTIAMLGGRGIPLVLEDADDAILREAVDGGRGVVYATAHLGPWEAMGPLLASRGFRVATLVRESYDPRFDRLHARLREGFGVRSIPRGAPGAATAIVRALRSGTIVGFPMDLGGRGVRGVDARWPDGVRLAPVGPAEIALRTGAAIVVGTPAPSRSGTLRLGLERVDPENHDASTLTRELVARLSARIVALPTAWPWMHDGSARRDLPEAAVAR